MSTVAHDKHNRVVDAAGNATARQTAEDYSFLRSSRPPEIDESGVWIVDLFCGCGGLTFGALEGLRRSGRPGSLALAVDNDPAGLGVLRQTLPGGERVAVRADLAILLGPLDAKARPDERWLYDLVPPGESLLVAGPPCQGHSALNNHTRHDDPRNDLYLAVARFALLTQPKAIVIENVRGVGSDRRAAVERCASALEEFGYEVTSQELDMSLVGVPQTRIRHLLIATRGKQFQWDLPTLQPRTVRWAIEDLLDVEGSTPFDSPSRMSPENRRRIRWLFEHEAYDLPNGERPRCHQSQHSYRSMYGRLRWDAPAQTVTSGFGSMGQGRYVHPACERTLTPHEAARLQCLPDFVRLPIESRRSILAEMIGNAMPPLVGARVVEALVHQHLL